MSFQKRLVLLLKSKNENETSDKYEIDLGEKNYKPLLVKTLDFEYKNLDLLNEFLNNPDDYCGIVFSSPRCVNVVKLALNGKAISDIWKEKDNYAVGLATYETAQKDLELNCLGKESGNAYKLADIINAKTGYTKPFLYPHGNLKMDILKSNLRDSHLKELCVYDTITNENIGYDLKVATEDYTILPEFIVFFSPSGLNASYQYLQNLPLKDLKLIAIGPTTEKAMKLLNLDIFATASQPTPEDLIDALNKL